MKPILWKIGTRLASSAAIGALALAPSAARALDDGALPSGGQVVGGSASFDYSSPNELHIHQSTDRAVIDWDSFDIGANALTQFHQSSSSSIAVNRVIGEGQDPTQILGTLRANGIVMVLDRNGVIFGEGSHVDVGSIVASTGAIDRNAFMAGGPVHLSGIDTDGAIVNRGTISVADAGLAAFVAPTVVNSGSIVAKLGRVQLASGDTSTLDLYGDGLIEVAVADKKMKQAITNTGLIHAEGGTIQITAAAAKTVVNSVINLDGVVSAASATVKGGKIILGGGNITIAKDAVLDASGTEGGSIIAYADNETHVAGTLKAINGGFIETSATNRVTIAESARIDTGGGQWLIDPTNFTIADSGGDITTATLAAQLAANNITIETASAGSDAGDIFVEDALTWTGTNTLTLKAHRNIEVNAAIANTTGGSLVLRADKESSGTGTITFGGSGSIALSGGGRADLYYNPTAYTTPTNFSGNITGTHTAWMLVNDVGQLQAMNTNLAGAYALGKNIDASTTASWNSGAGFAPVGSSNAVRFTGQFDGLGHTIHGLTINRVTDYAGLFGAANGATITNVGLIGGSIRASRHTGGLVGNVIGNTTISGSYSTAEINGADNVGGLVGRSESSSISNSYATGNVTSANGIAGGLVGSSGSSTITNSYATGDVSSTEYVGGLVGSHWGSSTMSYSYATGNVTATSAGALYAGGLAGSNHTSSIGNSYATGNVTGGTRLGGLVGTNTSGTITNSYATGNVSGGANAGGLIGVSSSGTISHSYWNTQSSGQATSAGGTGLTTAQMMQMANFSGWSIRDTAGTGTIWRIYEGYTAPLLAHFLTPLTVSANNVTITYSGTPHTGGSTYSATGLKSGDDITALLGAAVFGGSSQGATDPGTYALELVGGLYSGQLGYDISYGSAGTLIIERNMLPLDAPRIINAKLSTTTQDNKLTNIALLPADATDDTAKSDASACLISIEGGGCILF